LGHIPERVSHDHNTDTLDSYFRVARGRSAGDSACSCIRAGEMTKWIDTNYHYIVPEFTVETQFSLDASRLLEQIREAQAEVPDGGAAIKTAIIGPLTYLWLGKSKDNGNKLDLLPRLLPVYKQLLDTLAAQGVEWVQIDEPALVTELDAGWQQAYRSAYQALATDKVNLLLATYFGPLLDNLALVQQLPVQ